MQKAAQIILYNQLREDYIYTKYTHFIYIHNTGKIKFQWKDFILNTKSKIIDYAAWKYVVEALQTSGKTAEFLIETSFFSGLISYARKYNIQKYILVKPTENYVYDNFLKIQKKLGKIWIELEFLSDTQSFFLSHTDFLKQYQKPPIMEFFYRFMRKKENILLEETGEPVGGQWNYDTENRKFDKKHQKTWNFSLEKNEFVREAEEYYTHELPNYIPTNREEALKLLEYFLQNHLDSFGKLEDAMYQNDNYVHHSLLSTSINFGFLSAREVVEAVEKSDTAINNKEGFIRQILGWREYMYHFFQFYKDDIYSQNFLEHTHPLPNYFWKDAEMCDMNCLSTTLKQVQSQNTSHHIQRLMIIGNFALLAGLNPHELNKWFFEYYTDAFEWVVTPNVLSMSQFADGWKLATKPYIASANYINSMSDYCKNCRYDPKEKYTDDACPMNYLYWAFVSENKATFEKGRQQFVVKNLEKIDIVRIKELKEKFLEKLYP
jgi:deoxyribodipyrimidine photolyase-related protein